MQGTIIARFLSIHIPVPYIGAVSDVMRTNLQCVFSPSSFLTCRMDDGLLQQAEEFAVNE
jgi:hypothetical protein